jgi:hypothetical protein
MDAISMVGARCRCGRLIESDSEVGVVVFNSEPVYEQGSPNPLAFVTTRREVRCIECAPPSMAEIAGE